MKHDDITAAKRSGGKSFRIAKKVALLFCLFFSAHMIKAQQNNTFYFMDAVPQSSVLNPAFSTSCNYIGLPLISSFHVDLGNTGFSYNQLFPKQDGARIVDFDYLERRLHNLDLMNAQVHFDLFSLGMWYGDYFFTLRVTEKTGLFISYPKNLFLVPWEGNSSYVGKTARINRFGANFNHYREYSLSASGWMESDLKLGLRAGLLFGKLNLSTRREALNIFTEENTHHLDISGSYRVNSTLPVEVSENADGTIDDIQMKEDISIGRLLMNMKNPGFKLDVGGIYTGMEDLVWYGSLNDIGLMYWSSELNNVEVQQSFQFEGFRPEDFQTNDYAQLMLDSLQDSYEMSLTHEPYLTLLPLKSYLGATYQVNNRIKAGILQRNLLYKWRLYPSLTLSLNMELLDFFKLSASYSYNKYGFNNFGAGFSLQSDKVQFYMVTDNLMAIKPTATRNLNLRFGLNFFFGCGDKSFDTRGAQGTGTPNCFWIKRQQENESILPKK